MQRREIDLNSPENFLEELIEHIQKFSNLTGDQRNQLLIQGTNVFKECV